MKLAGFEIKLIPFLGFFAIAGLLGFLNHFRSIPLFAEYSTNENRAALVPDGIKTVLIDDVRKAIENKSHTIVDVRLRAFYDDAHIPTAVNVPEDVQNPDSVLYSAAPNTSPDSPLIIYCDGGSCAASIFIASKLQMLGFRDISVYLGGWSEWKETEALK
jgi:3-mercaptopyruvate sulfurtransferase SseA